MKGHLYRAFVLCKPQIFFLMAMQLLCSAFLILFAALSVNQPNCDMAFVQIVCAAIYLLMFLLSMSMLTNDYFKIDEKTSTALFLCATPKSVKAQVAGKYFFILIIGLFVLAANFVTDIIVTAITLGGTSSLTALLMLFCMELTVNAVEIPFVIRFGSGKGAAIKGAVFGGIMIALIIYGLFGDISFFLGSDPIGAFMEYMNGDGPMWTMAITPYASVAAYYLSYLVSVKLWRKGAECYE